MSDSEAEAPKPRVARSNDHEFATVHRSNQSRLCHLERDADELAGGMAALRIEVNRLLETQGQTPFVQEPAVLSQSRPALHVVDWEATVEEARKHLRSSNINFEGNQTFDLLSLDEMAEINTHLSRPTYGRIPWDRWDFMFSFVAGIAGGLTDVVMGTPGHFVQQAVADKNHWLGGLMERVHAMHPGGAPIDYQGPHFGGRHHRGLTIGHDLARPLAGIQQFRDGVFRGSYYTDGVKHVVEAASNRLGRPFQPMTWAGAVLAWLIHNFCDFFSSASLPIPGTSWFYESPSREIRVLVQREMYQQGINLRHLTLQTLSPFVVEVIVRCYLFARYRTHLKDDAFNQKRAELFSTAHALSLGFNMGKVVLLQNPLLINMPQVIALMLHLGRLVLLESKRTGYSAIVHRNVREFKMNQTALEQILIDHPKVAVG